MPDGSLFDWAAIDKAVRKALKTPFRPVRKTRAKKEAARGGR